MKGFISIYTETIYYSSKHSPFLPIEEKSTILIETITLRSSMTKKALSGVSGLGYALCKLQVFGFRHVLFFVEVGYVEKYFNRTV